MKLSFEAASVSLINNDSLIMKIEAISLGLASSFQLFSIQFRHIKPSQFATLNPGIHPKMVPQSLSVGSSSVLAVLATFLNSGEG